MDVSPTMPARALAGRYYTSPEVFARARDRLFHRSWQFACHASQIPAPGDYFAFSILDQDLVVVRDRDGAARCFYNVCQHRGHVLVEGTGRTRLLVCPYHAWSYELDGALRNAPGTRGLPNFDRESVCLTEVRLDEFCGFLFVSLDPDAPPMERAFPGVAQAVRAFCPDVEDRKFAHEHDTQESCNWLVAVENYNECYHCKVVHRDFASGVIDPQSYNIRAFGAAKCLHHTARAQTSKTAWYDTSGSDYASFFLWPAFSLQIYPSGLVNTYHWRPLGAEATHVYRGWYSRDGAVDDRLQRVIDLDRDCTFAEDLQLLRRVQRGLGSRGYRPGPLVISPSEGIDSEHSIGKLQEWMCEAVDA
ncbi:MAG: aromatic ring-hydroxylating dioxygenase subunit alpha [Alphaproteobacteria bacterium]|nr:aromatic ring-hydroxylating dioxygenase subunit alpha [Alphaproteobacteria bacterium]